MTQKQIKMNHGFFALVGETSMSDSLRQVVPGEREGLWLPGSVFQIHFYPYLSPLSKLIVSIYGDFSRVRSLEAIIADDPEKYCFDTPAYVGQTVPNCFLTKYRAMAKTRAFVTPAFGVIYETQYRQAVMKTRKEAKTPMDAFAFSAVSIENLVSLLEPGDLVYDRTQFTHPVGFLAIYGSPELPAISIGQDLQHLALSSKLLPLITPQLEQLTKGLSGMRGALTPQDDALAKENSRS